jgi:peroxiredoxin
MTETKLVHPGDLFPALTVNLPTGRTLGLPDVMVVALSVDDEATTRELIAKNGLRFPVGHSADAAAIAEATGAFVNSGPRYLREHAPASQSR